MAGNAALVTGDMAGALDLLDAARGYAIIAQAGTLQGLIALDRARALVATGELEAADASLSEARSLQPENAETRLLSATLLRRLDRLTEAQEQIEEAARLDPLDPAVGLEAGVIAIMGGREEAARASWMSVTSLAPDTPEAAIAQTYLDQLGPEPESPPQP
jgi:tetratricopeptide (TPR) repeat protein